MRKIYILINSVNHTFPIIKNYINIGQPDTTEGGRGEGVTWICRTILFYINIGQPDPTLKTKLAMCRYYIKTYARRRNIHHKKLGRFDTTYAFSQGGKGEGGSVSLVPIDSQMNLISEKTCYY